jgi:hypothetical protein
MFQSTSSRDTYIDAVANGVASAWCRVRWDTVYSVNRIVDPVIEVTTRLVPGL